jgi:hypothetical protein
MGCVQVPVLQHRMYVHPYRSTALSIMYIYIYIYIFIYIYIERERERRCISNVLLPSPPPPLASPPNLPLSLCPPLGLLGYTCYFFVALSALLTLGPSVRPLLTLLSGLCAVQAGGLLGTY